MRITLASTTKPLLVVTGTPEKPMDVTLQNTNAVHAVYFSLSSMNKIEDGLKLEAGQSYTNGTLTRPLYVLPTAANDVINVESQDSVLGMIMQLLALRSR